MPASFWQRRNVFVLLNTLDRSGFAFEFLRRNPEFRNERSRRLARLGEEIASDPHHRQSLLNNWGLLFRS
jgi:hypothetical protein